MLRSPWLAVVLAAAGVGACRSGMGPGRSVAGYQRFHNGDKEGARREFERIAAANPSGLAARFALLQALNDQVGSNRALQPEFERTIDTFIDEATARHERSATDDEALFYLGNAHLLRASYRFDHDKGMWGAARDGARSKRLADAYVKRRPEHADAYYMLGAYNYYVEIAPSFVKLIRRCCSCRRAIASRD